MPTKIDTPDEFLKQLTRLERKYGDILPEFHKLLVQLRNDERPGDLIPHTGHAVYKVRLKNPSAQRGKRGGFRVIYYVRLSNRVMLLTIYSKTQQSDISPKEIKRLIDEFLEDFDENEDDTGDN